MEKTFPEQPLRITVLAICARLHLPARPKQRGLHSDIFHMARPVTGRRDGRKSDEPSRGPTPFCPLHAPRGSTSPALPVAVSSGSGKHLVLCHPQIVPSATHPTYRFFMGSPPVLVMPTNTAMPVLCPQNLQQRSRSRRSLLELLSWSCVSDVPGCCRHSQRPA